MKKQVRLRRVESKTDDGPSVYVLVYHDIDNPHVFFIHGAYSSENKVLAELKRLGKCKSMKLSRKQKLANTRAEKAKQPKAHIAPIDFYSIRELVVR